LLLLLVQILYLCSSSLTQSLQLLPHCLPADSDLTRELVSLSHPVTRATLGVFGCVVGALTIERFLSSTVPGPYLRCFLNTLSLIICVGGPVAVITCFILIRHDVFQSLLHLDSEYWFGVEICVYIIFPLLLLTVFGTVNCCKVSSSSRVLPTHQIQAIKINIGVTISTNMAMFLFLVQESLFLWRRQLLEMRDDPEFSSSVDSVLAHVTLSAHIVSTLLSIMVTMVSLLYCCISSDCCADCCCSSINDLEAIRYEQVQSKEKF